MPLSLLLCEGVAGSPDARVLAKLVAGRCAIEPAGSKYGLDSQVLIRRTIINGLVAGLRDADFDRDWTGPEANPEIWSKRAEGGVAHRLGWCWRRKEIENYLIDPIVVSNTLGLNAPDLAVYRTLLEKAANELHCYTAARAALSACRLRTRQFPNRWGTSRGNDNHSFPAVLTKSACRVGIRNIVRKCTSAPVPSADDVVRKFRELLPQYEGGGSRREHFLHCFAGKDLLVQLNAGLRSIGFDNFGQFRERILIGIENSQDDVATWIPEWTALRTAIDAFDGAPIPRL